MFKLFKKKVELKKENSIMHSFYTSKGVKLGIEIDVPDHFEMLVMHKGMLFNTLTSGKYKLDNKTFSELISSQKNRKTKQKYIKAVFHYINLSAQKLKIKFKKQYYCVDFLITDTAKFTDLMLLHTFKVDNEYSFNLLCEIFHELLLYNNGNYKNINEKSLDKFGISISSILPENNKSSIFNNKSTSQQSITSSQRKALDKNAENNNIKTSNENNKPTETITNKESLTTQNYQNQISQTQFPQCPNCGNIAKFNTIYCLKCGYKLK